MDTFDIICLHCGYNFGRHYGGSSTITPGSDWECPVPDAGPLSKGTKRASPHGSAGYFVSKVEAGQVWHNRQSGNTWEFDEIRDGSVYGHPIGSMDRSIHFGGVNKDQRPDNWNGNWYCQSIKGKATVKAQVPVKAVPKDERQAELDFFKATQPGQCACGIPRQQCDYHR